MNINLFHCPRMLLALAVLAVAPAVMAVPLPFLAPAGIVLGGSVAGLDGDDFFDLAALPAALPLEGDSLAVSSAGDRAAATARVGPGALDTRLDLQGVTGLTAADAVTSFVGDVLAPGGSVVLQVDLDSDLTLDAFGAFGFTELAYSVFLDGVALVEESVLLDGEHDRMDSFLHALAPAAGSLLSLEAFLVSGAEAGPRGFAAGSAAVRFIFEPAVAAVPEPGIALLLGSGLALLVMARAGRRDARAAARRGLPQRVR